MAITITVDGTDIMTITDIQLKLLAYDFPKVGLKERLINHIKNSINTRLNDTKNDLQNDWLPIIRSRYNSMPTQDADIGQLIFSQPDYLDYDGRNP